MPILPIPDSRDLVTFTVLIEGEAISNEYSILRIDTMKEVNRVPYARIIIADGDVAEQDFIASNSDLFIPGREVEVKAGYQSNEDTLFKGIIVKQSLKADPRKPSVCVVECRDKAYRMTLNRKNRHFEDSTDSDIMEIILGEYGLENEVEATQATHTKLIQFYVTDWDFINLRSEINGKVVVTDDGKVSIKSPSLDNLAEVTLTYGSSILSFETLMDGRTQYPAARSISWNSADQETMQMEAADSPDTGQGNLASDDLSGPMESGKRLLQHPGELKDQELQAWADSALLRSRMAKIMARISAAGDATVKPGSVIELDGMGDRFNGKAYVSGITHRISGGNWTMDIQTGLKDESFAARFHDSLQAPPASGMNAGIRGLQPGVVVALEGDPDGNDRIQVRLPILDPDDDGIWARIATLDAGENRGSFFRPEIGDEVIVGFMNDDPDYPVVLGMLNSSAKPAPATSTDDNHEKGFVTRSGIKVWFDDDKQVITISTPGGNVVEMNDDSSELKLEDGNGNRIILGSDGITLESQKDVIIKATGDLKTEGTNLELKANASLKAEGSAGTEVSSSATTVIKGSIVQIN